MKMSQKTEFEASEAAVAMQETFASMARRMRPKDKATQDDLVQEMATAVFENGGCHPLAYFRQIATRRASNALRNWFRSSPVDRALYQSRKQREGRFDVFDEPPKQEKFLQNLAREMDRNVPTAEDLIEWMKRSA